jgi:hypothetical protein
LAAFQTFFLIDGSAINANAALRGGHSALAVIYDQSSGWSKNGISPSKPATMTAALQRGVAGFVIGPGVQPPTSGLERICPGDVVFVQGHHRVWMSRLVRMMEERFSVKKDYLPSRMRRPLPDRLPKTTGRLVAGGDVSLARYLPARVLDDGMERVFGDVAEKLRSADAAFVNLECVLSTCGDFISKTGEKRPYFFRAPPQLANLLLHAGISAVVTSNNHTMDFGGDALLEQHRLLTRLGIAQAGSGSHLEAARRSTIIRCGEVNVALIGVDMTAPYAAATEQQPGVFHLPLHESLTSTSTRK